jgi:hypothetical protein
MCPVLIYPVVEEKLISPEAVNDPHVTPLDELIDPSTLKSPPTSVRVFNLWYKLFELSVSFVI